MRGVDEREVVGRAERIAGVEPRAEATRRAIERTRAALRDRRRQRPWFARRMVVGPGIAAGIVVALGVAWMNLTHERVDAAELLRRVLDTNGTYKGWVHIWTEGEPPASYTPAQIAASSGIHRNTADGTEIYVSHGGNRPSIFLLSPSTLTGFAYNGYPGVPPDEIVVYDLGPAFARTIPKRVGRTPVDLTSDLAWFETQIGRKPLEVKHSRSDGLDRFDIVYFDDDEEPEEILAARYSVDAVPMTSTLWVDPESRLIGKERREWLSRRGEGGVARTETVWHKTYGEPVLRDIYDAGAPRDAKVADYRLAGAAREWMDRLSAKADAGFGDAVAVVTETWVTKDGTLDADRGELYLHIRQGRRRFFGDYFIKTGVGENARNHDGTPLIPRFRDWPAPDVNEVLDRLSIDQVHMFFVSDGERAWGGNPYSRFSTPGELDDKLICWWAQWPPAALCGQLWPSRTAWGLTVPGVEAEVLREDDRPRQVGIRVVKFDPASPEPDERRVSEERVHWLDPSRDDMPVESVVRRYAEAGGPTDVETRTTYLDYARLPEGGWYPNRWRARTIFYMHAKPGERRVQEYHLQVYPGLAVDERWFDVPKQWRGPHENR